jgi:hypothetical protein
LMTVAFKKREMFRLVTGIARVDNAILSRPTFVYKKTHIYVLLQFVYLFCTYVLFHCFDSWVWICELSSKNIQHLPLSYSTLSIVYVMKMQHITFTLLLTHRSEK